MWPRRRCTGWPRSPEPELLTRLALHVLGDQCDHLRLELRVHRAGWRQWDSIGDGYSNRAKSTELTDLRQWDSRGDGYSNTRAIGLS